jgi:hypothetical protein
LVKKAIGQHIEDLYMKVILEPISGTAKDNLERAKLEIERVLAFRGSVVGVKAKGRKITVEFEINPKWDLPMSEKVIYLNEWITAKVKVVFKVTKVE